ncbi:hypothetical protein [Psychroserpens ponticola]|uniref:DUF4367 domain-containing protein n=1 Tax=Psychroserpens ponticola TaxID=2932268 RepID=A0ABY7RVH7_9FLAO|nr:hypothetical protein [Psychroserpens ponticola]WCO00271.1 hypothetical protein MUN68_009315 [Psychroserpens ponticola]
MKIRFLTTLFLVFISCKNVTVKETEKVEIKIDSTELKIEKAEKQSENLKLNSFLENPIDLQEFKTKKNRNVTTSVNNGLEYQYHPKIKDSIFYGYNFITNNIGAKGANEIVVFKYGENKHKYEDETEILIELRIFNKDSDLGKANLIGISKTKLESEFGTDYLALGNRIVYSNKNKVLILELNNTKVKSFNYIKLNTENIDRDLIEQIIE